MSALWRGGAYPSKLGGWTKVVVRDAISADGVGDSSHASGLFTLIARVAELIIEAHPRFDPRTERQGRGLIFGTMVDTGLELRRALALCGSGRGC